MCIDAVSVVGTVYPSLREHHLTFPYFPFSTLNQKIDCCFLRLTVSSHEVSLIELSLIALSWIVLSWRGRMAKSSRRQSMFHQTG